MQNIVGLLKVVVGETVEHGSLVYNVKLHLDFLEIWQQQEARTPSNLPRITQQEIQQGYVVIKGCKKVGSPLKIEFVAPL